MHLVSNSLNAKALDALEGGFVVPLLTLLIGAKVAKAGVSDVVAPVLSPDQASRFRILLAIKLSKKETLEQRCNLVVKRTSKKALQRAQQLYTQQASEIASGNYSLPQEEIALDVKRLFVNILYEKLFDSDELWQSLGLPRLTREVFHENFRRDNGNPSTCPYCDLDTMNSQGTRIVEHFLPKSKFPLLAVHQRNLFSACQGCNSSAAKGARVVGDLTSPYVKEIGSCVHFANDPVKSQLSISAGRGDVAVDGFLRLVRLPTRYQDLNTWHQFEGRRQALLESLQHVPITDEAELERFVKIQQKGAVLSFAVLHWARCEYWPLRTGPQLGVQSPGAAKRKISTGAAASRRLPGTPPQR